MNQVSKNVYYVGVNDCNLDLFEGIYKAPNGVSYNSYVIIDERIAVVDSVEEEFGDEWISNLKEVLNGREPDYLIIQHMEPDHSANALRFSQEFPNAKIVGNQKIFTMLNEYFATDFAEKRVVVADGQTLSLGRHELKFVFAPMVHWPEVMFTYDSFNRTLFSADAFGKFGALGTEDNWVDEARRYYFGIVGKYGKQVIAALNKISSLDISVICPLHGPVLDDNLGYYIGLYKTWASYAPEEDGVAIVYSSVYGHTKKAVELLESKLLEKGLKKVKVYDIIRDDRSLCVSEAFRYSKLVLATTTYNAEIFPAMGEFIDCLTARNFQNRTVAFIENGTWAPVAAKLMKAKLEKCSGLNFIEQEVKIRSNLDSESRAQLESLAVELGK